MLKKFPALCFVITITLCFSGGPANAQGRDADDGAPKAGETAPDFTINYLNSEENITLSDYQGKKPVVLLFGSYT